MLLSLFSGYRFTPPDLPVVELQRIDPPGSQCGRYIQLNFGFTFRDGAARRIRELIPLRWMADSGAGMVFMAIIMISIKLSPLTPTCTKTKELTAGSDENTTQPTRDSKEIL